MGKKSASKRPRGEASGSAPMTDEEREREREMQKYRGVVSTWPIAGERGLVLPREPQF
jgi:hypothetical protein